MHGHRHDPPRTRRAALRPSSTLDLGMDVHNASMAVADVAPEHGAEVTSLGTIGTRQGDMAQLSRRRPSTATQRIGVYDAGPWGSWRSRDLTPTGYDCWGGGPSRLPPKPGARVNTARRDAVPLPRLARAGDLPAVAVPAVVSAAAAGSGWYKDHRTEREAGTRRRPVRWSPPPGEPPDHPSYLTGSGIAEAPRTTTS
jgi:hypothetical protein